MVCGAPMSFFFEKDFGGELGLSVVEYWKCMNCGLTIAKTLHDMPKHEWDALNVTLNAFLFSVDTGQDWLSRERRAGIVRLHAQAQNIDFLFRQDLLSVELPWIDYGCGDGVLADDLAGRRLPTYKFDAYMQGSNYLTVDDLKQRFSFVVNTAVFEHVRRRRVVDEIFSLVADDGVFAFHTNVVGHIRKNPNSLYLLPVHCTLFTNDAMQWLFDKWGFVVSLYHIPTSMWFWFRKETDALRRFMESKPAKWEMHNAFVRHRK